MFFRLAIIATLCSVAQTALAQRTTGTMSGTVSDETGGVLPGVTVSVRGAAIAGTETAITNSQGVFRFVSLPGGLYDVTYKLAGFRPLVRSDVRVYVGSTTEEKPSLAVGT